MKKWFMFIEVKNLKKAYKNGKVQSEILKGVSFDVKAEKY